MTSNLWLLSAAGCFAVTVASAMMVDNSDVRSGRRDGDYGSNIGYVWPWSPLAQISFVGIIACLVAAAP